MYLNYVYPDKQYCYNSSRIFLNASYLMHLSRCVYAWSCLTTDLKRIGVKNSSVGLVLPVGSFLLFSQTNPAVPQRGRVGSLWSHHATSLDTHFLAKKVNNWSYFVDKWNKVWCDFFLKTKYGKDPILFSLPIDGLLLGTTVENKVRTGSCCGSLCWLAAVRRRLGGIITYFTSTLNQEGDFVWDFLLSEVWTSVSSTVSSVCFCEHHCPTHCCVSNIICDWQTQSHC